jgi:hypothetical protein
MCDKANYSLFIDRLHYLPVETFLNLNSINNASEMHNIKIFNE